EQRVDRRVVEVGLDEPAREQALELRCEDEQIAAGRIVERLDAEAIARDQAGSVSLVPDCQRELAAQPLGEGVARVLVEMRQDLRVAAAPEPVRAKLTPQLEVVVELPVLDRPDRTVLVRDRLMAAL